MGKRKSITPLAQGTPFQAWVQSATSSLLKTCVLKAGPSWRCYKDLSALTSFTGLSMGGHR